MARRRGGLFLPLDVNFGDDPLITAVGEKPAWLYLLMCLRSKSLLSDGVLTEPQVEKLAVKDWQKRLASLLTVADRDGKTLVMDITDESDPVRRLWITAWDDHNDRAETVDERRERDRDRKRQERLSVQSPFGRSDTIQTGSVRRVEKSREEKSRASEDAAAEHEPLHALDACTTPRFCPIHHKQATA